MKYLLILLICVSFSATAQDSLYLEKVQTLDAMVENLYGVISGDAGIKRDWDLFRYLFAPGAQLIPIQKMKNGDIKARYLAPEDYIEKSGPFLEEKGFIETEINRVTENYGNLTHIFSSYAAFKSSKDTEPFMRGINSIQLMYDGNRYWIVNISWEQETEENPLTEKYGG